MSKASKTLKKAEQADTAIDNATLANMLAELRADLLTKPDSLAVRFENKLAAIDTKLDGIQSTVTDHEQRISDLESGLNQLQFLEAKVTSITENNAKLKAKLTASHISERGTATSGRLSEALKTVELSIAYPNHMSLDGTMGSCRERRCFYSSDRNKLCLVVKTT